MTDFEARFERLERRVEQLETLLRQVLARTPGAPRVEFAPARPKPPVAAAPAVTSAPAPAPSFQLPKRPDLVTRSSDEGKFDLEEWVGRRGLLVVGVVALLATGAFFLDYAFQHHWIPPLVRSIISITAGIGLAVWGHRLIRRDLRRYGGPVVGAGGGLVYLGIWAAAGPFDLVDRRVGIIALAVAAAVFALLAQRYELEGLAISALLGAFAAPLVLKTPTPNPELFLGYTEVVGIGGGIVAYAMDWRRTMAIAAVGYMLLAATVLSLDDSAALVRPVGLSFLIVGAVLGSEVSRRRPWWESRVVMVFGAWLLLAAGMPNDASDPVRWLGVGTMALVCGVVFVHLRATTAFDRDQEGPAAEGILYLLSPLVLTVFILGYPPAAIDGHTAMVPALVALPFLVDGWSRLRGHALVAGIGLWAWAIGIQFAPVGAVVGWAALGATVAGAYTWGRRPWLPAAAAALYAGSIVALFSDALPVRRSQGLAFSDPWALALYTVLAAGGLIIWWWKDDVEDVSLPRQAVWWLGGATLLTGVSVNIVNHFEGLPGADLAGNLALSVWWLVFAAALVAIGFRREKKAVRSAGLAVAVAATVKVLLYDLSELEALYRIGAFFALAAIALGVAYAYHRQEQKDVENQDVE